VTGFVLLCFALLCFALLGYAWLLCFAFALSLPNDSKRQAWHGRAKGKARR
jgi:hypothetical protein